MSDIKHLDANIRLYSGRGLSLDSAITNDTATSLTLTASHNSVTLSNASPVAITVPLGASVGSGKRFRLKNIGVGTVTITGSSGQQFLFSTAQNTIELSTGDTTEFEWNGTYWLVWF